MNGMKYCVFLCPRLSPFPHRRYQRHTHQKRTKLVRDRSIFSCSKIILFNWMKLVYRLVSFLFFSFDDVLQPYSLCSIPRVEWPSFMSSLGQCLCFFFLPCFVTHDRQLLDSYGVQQTYSKPLFLCLTTWVMCQCKCNLHHRVLVCLLAHLTLVLLQVAHLSPVRLH